MSNVHAKYDSENVWKEQNHGAVSVKLSAWRIMDIVNTAQVPASLKQLDQE